MTTAGEWCARCHHMIVRGPRGWVHASDDDWSGQACRCVNQLLPCLPATPWRPGLPRFLTAMWQ